MTRKRFVKLMMAAGYSRNEARETARLVQGDGTYENTYATIMALKNGKSLYDAISSIVESFGRLCDALTDGIDAFVEAFNKTIREPKGEKE